MKTNKGFSLVELMVSMAIFSIILLAIGGILSETMRSWTRASDQQIQFREAKAAFDSMYERISTAEINPYWGYEFGSGEQNSPTGYKKLSNLHFVSGNVKNSAGGTPALFPSSLQTNRFGHGVFFHGSYGRSDLDEAQNLNLLLNSWGYFCEWGNDSDKAAPFLLSEGNLSVKNRFRLMELQVEAEDVTTFTNADDGAQLDIDEATNKEELFEWFTKPIEEGKAHLLAENIIALIIAPVPGQQGDDTSFDETELAPNYYYDTRAEQHSSGVSDTQATLTEHQLPPIIRITMVAISETSAIAIEGEDGSPAPDFGLDDLFEDIADYGKDLKTLEQTLIDQNIDFRTFSNTVKLRNSRWSDPT